MPGKILLLLGLELIAQRPAVLVWFLIVVSNLGGVPLYLFVRDFLHDRDAALYSFVFYLVLPAKLLFLPVPNTVTPVLIIGWAWLWTRWLRRQCTADAVILGTALYALILYEPTPLAMGALFFCLTAHALFVRTVQLRLVLTHAAIAAAAFLATDLAMRLAFGFDLLGTFAALARDAAEFNATSHRPYWTWVWHNPVDFLLGVGVVQAVLLCAFTAMSVTNSKIWRDVSSGRAAALTVGIVASLVALDLLGINRGEVVRLWIFLACFAQIPAAYVCARLNSRAAMMLATATSVVQTAIATSMLGFAQP